MSVELTLALVAFGVFVAAYGTLIGAGGGFLIVPGLLLAGLATSDQAAGTSLVAVAATAISGAIMYGRMRRIDLKTGALLAAASVPGSLVGAYLTRWLSGPRFDLAFGGLMLLIATWLLLKPARLSSRASRAGGRGYVARRLVDREGTIHEYTLYLPGAIACSALTGVLSSTLGIGGGVILVPVLVGALGVPAHVATATTQLVLSVSSVLGAASHAALGHVLVGPALALSVGAVVGARLGTRLSTRVGGAALVRLLALALVAVGVRLILRGFGR